jgi:dipeptidyl aminopeptidase/acylaminoacyl peptidase
MWLKDELSQLAEKSLWGKPLSIERVAGGNLSANIHMPPNFQSNKDTHHYPAVLLLHGLGGSRHEINGLFIRLAAELALNGFVVLRFDFRGQAETGGDPLRLTLDSQIEDAAEAFEFLKEQRYIDGKRISVAGFSFGGLTAACFAATRPDLCALILWEAVFDMKAVIKRLYGATAIKSVRTRGYMQAGMLQLSPAFFESLDRYDVAELMGTLKAPVLLVQGSHDSIVTVDTAYQWKRALSSCQPDIRLIADADHGFTHESWAREAIKNTCDWLQECLAAAHK